MLDKYIRTVKLVAVLITKRRRKIKGFWIRWIQKEKKNRLVRRVVRIYLTVYLWKWYGILKLARVLINYTGAVDQDLLNAE